MPLAPRRSRGHVRRTCKAWSRCAPGGVRSARPPGHGCRCAGRPRAPGRRTQAVSSPKITSHAASGQGAKTRRQHARHGDRHQQVGHIGVDARPRRGATAGPPRSARRSPPRPRSMQRGENVQDPGGGHRADHLLSGGRRVSAASEHRRGARQRRAGVAGAWPAGGRLAGQYARASSASSGPELGSVAPDGEDPAEGLNEDPDHRGKHDGQQQRRPRGARPAGRRPRPRARGPRRARPMWPVHARRRATRRRAAPRPASAVRRSPCR